MNNMDLIEVSENPNRHPWELSRTSCIIQVLRSLNIHGNILDIGCGDSYFDHNLLKEDPELCIYGVDIFLKDEDEINGSIDLFITQDDETWIRAPYNYNLHIDYNDRINTNKHDNQQLDEI